MGEEILQFFMFISWLVDLKSLMVTFEISAGRISENRKAGLCRAL